MIPFQAETSYISGILKMDSCHGAVLSDTLIALFVSDTIAKRIMTWFWLYFTLINLETALGGGGS